MSCCSAGVCFISRWKGEKGAGEGDVLIEGFFLVLGAMSKALATIVTQPLIVAKVGLQSRPPPARQGKPFKSFVEVMGYIVEHEGLWGLFKGIGPQITKGLLVQGLLMMTKERYVGGEVLLVESDGLTWLQNGGPLHHPLRLC